ncbi:MAG TPA: MinD/ParA family protein [Phototrophicaceae bacterium]|nr:MinD/ParA family protein [Phototrophicaceae bacterium]
MSKIISVHSFRGGTGKSNTTANLSALFAAKGLRVGVIDTDINSPGIHVLFGLNEDDIKYSLNDYLWGKCEIEKAAHDVTALLNSSAQGGPGAVPPNGKVFLIPSSIKVGEIARILREGYDVGLLNDGFQNLVRELKLDVLLIDTHPGLNEETLLSVAISDALAIIMRPDQQDYQGTGVTVEVARKLDVPRMLLIVNKTPPSLNFDEVKARVEATYNCPVGAVLPHSDEMMVLASSGVFVLRYPDHPITQKLRKVADTLLS